MESENDCQRKRDDDDDDAVAGEERRGMAIVERLYNDNVRGGTALVNSTWLKWHERGENSDRIARGLVISHIRTAARAAVARYYVHIYEVWPVEKLLTVRSRGAIGDEISRNVFG